MKLSIEKEDEIKKKVAKSFEEFKNKKGLTKSVGRKINPLEYLNKIKIAEEFAHYCKVSILYNSDEELKAITSRLNFEVQIVVNDIADNY
ncbi:hypothetical protein [Chryseobacterium sp. SIMBA_038]|uniref:hypothetical protein n=1 Tax=Chryseobacterium sp. SIMBA_038 TaxID=3085780 RepID=UPI00397A14A3